MQRGTKQREAICAVFEQHEAPLLPQEVLKLAKHKVPSLGLATVYRTLNSLVQDNLLRLVTLPAEAPRYEKAGKHHHHHFVCRICKQVFEVAGCSASLQDMVPPGFKMDEHEITLYGLCATCLQKNNA